VRRLQDPQAHAEFPHSRTRRLIANVRIEDLDSRLHGNDFTAHANFVVYRFRRGGQESAFVGRYRYRLRVVGGELRIALREAILDSEELGRLGAVSFIL
jgi:p-cumate 2,3-dioxygenase beta subunit